MNRAEVDKLLYDIRKKSNKNNSQRYFELLNDIFQIKPVTMLYYNVKAKLLCDVGRYDEAVQLLTATINWCIIEEEHIETCKVLQMAYNFMGMDTFFKQWLYMENYIKIALKQDNNSYKKILTMNEHAVKLQNEFLNGVIDCDGDTMCLSNAYYELWYFIEGIIMYALSLVKNNQEYKKSEFFKYRVGYEINHSFLLDQLLYSKNPYVLFANDDNYDRCMAISKALTMLNQDVYIIMPAVTVNVEYNIDIKETVKVSMDNSEIVYDKLTKIRPLKVLLDGKIIGNNTHLVLESLSNMSRDDFLILIGESEDFINLNSSKKRMQCLFQPKVDILQGRFNFGYYGSYESYISRIYMLNVKDEVEEKSKYKFSIVIPVRNSAESLRYTLQTCLEQRGMNENDYEIVVSDNSPHDYFEIEKLVKEINSHKIKYYRTPKELNLTKSFEYAFIRAKGDFIFSIGADDAVLPWGLEVLQEVLKKFPEEEIFKWERGFFVWPNNSKVASMAGEFVIPRSYVSTKVNINRRKGIELLIDILKNTNLIYGMPMLYINSGFRRSYFKKLLKSTGRLWNGVSQDLYMGIVNLMINETIIDLEYPITIAGMTSNSVGINANLGTDNVNPILKKMAIDYSYGKMCAFGRECEFLPINLDTGNFYSSLLRVASMDDSAKLDLILSNIDWNKVFKDMAIRSNCSDLLYDSDVRILRYSAYYHSYEFGKWFDDNVLEYIMSPKTMLKKSEKSYYEGFFPEGGLQLDSRKFNVNNVYEATKLFENICNL